ncbi:MAG TPA: hypothetical protein VJC07_00775, partial [Candidatus Nanoarchaeia archaeon]|nr:hypothetical protein [Candidatus Nanoarchaeia archaeon]
MLLLFLNLSIIVENEVLTGLTVYHEDTLYVIDQDNLVGRQYIEPNNDIKIGRLINSMQLINIQKGNIIEIKEIENYLPPENIEFSEVYAFNNEVKADEATFKDSARGTIYRCEFFDYDSELCLSSWQVYLENVDGEFAAPIGESAYAISGIALQGEEFVLEEITEEETSEELNATTEEEIDATEEIEGDENETAVSQEIGPEEAALEEVDINIVGSYCIYTGERFKACERIVWQGGTYAKGYITGGETLKLSSEQHVNEFIYCQDLDKPGKKAANAYLFDEKGKLLTTHFGTKVDCNTQTTTFNEEEFYNKPVPKEEPEIISEPEEEIIVEMPLPEGVTVDEIEVDGLRAYETTRLLSTYGTPLGEEDSKQFQVVLNRPTKWSKKVILPKTVEGVRVNIPKEAARLKVRNEIGEFVDYDVAGEAKTSGNLLTGRAISEELQIGDSENGEKELLVNEPVDEVTIEYELPGPTSTEEELVRSNKKVTIQSDVHYTNVLAYTRVDNVESNQLSLLWLNEKGAYEQQAFYDYVDTDNDGRINEVWWVVPSLSGQVYIVISSQEQYNMSVQSALNKNSGGQDSLVGTYPSSCTLDRLSCNDGQVETSLALIPANNISSITAFIYNNSIGVGDCSSIADVEVIYEWWRAGNVPATTCNVSVSNGTNTYVADTTCPGNVSNPGISVVNVSNAISGLSWTCKTFFNTTTFPFINATMMRTANGLNFSVDILAFNVTFANDTDVPNVTNLTNTPVNVLRHETIYINSTVADTAAVNGLVETVILQINFSNGTFTNYSTTGVPIDSVSANYYNNTVSTNWSGVHSIKWFANDTTGKINSSERSTFQVNDTQPPNLTSATETPDPVEFGRAIELNITCDDDVACSVGIVQATFPNGTKTNYTATLNWYVNDTSGNLNTSVLAGIAADFTAQDTTPPNATLPLETPDPVGAGSVIEVNITCEDANACSDAIVQAHFLFNGTKTNYTTTLTAGRFWNRSIPTNSIATGVDLNWTVNDTSNNVNRSEGSTFSIVAANSPANVTNISISPASPNTIDQLNCSYVVILHNQQATTINVSWLNGSTYAESTELNYINNTLNSTLLTSGKQGEGETWNCTVNTTSITGNANSTTVTVVTTKPSLINLAPVNGTNFTAGNFNTTLDFTYIENTNQNGDLFIFASNSTGSNTRDGLVYYAPNQANATAVSYNFTSIPVYSNSSGLVGLWHFDNRSAYGENQTYAFDFSENDNNITLESGV